MVHLQHRVTPYMTDFQISFLPKFLCTWRTLCIYIIYLRLARTIYIRYIYGVFGTVCVCFWPTRERQAFENICRSTKHVYLGGGTSTCKVVIIVRHVWTTATPQTRTCARMHTHAQTYTHTHIHTQTRTHIQTHTLTS